jgi:hypothetical protein
MTSHSPEPTSSTEDENAPDLSPEIQARGDPAAANLRAEALIVTPDGKLEANPAETSGHKPEETALDRAARYLLGPTAYCA